MPRKQRVAAVVHLAPAAKDTQKHPEGRADQLSWSAFKHLHRFCDSVTETVVDELVLYARLGTSAIIGLIVAAVLRRAKVTGLEDGV